MEHKATENEDIIKKWEEDEVVQYIQYLHRKGTKDLEDETKIDKIVKIVEDEEIDGEELWGIKKAKELRGKLGNELANESRAIYTHLKKLKKLQLDAPCEFQLQYVPIVDWETETLQQYIAIIDPNGKYYKYMSNFKDISGDTLLHHIQNQSASILSKDPFCIDNDDDRLVIWKAIKSIAKAGNTQTPDAVDVVLKAFKELKSKLNKDTVSESARGSSHHDDGDDAKEKALDMSMFKDKDPSKWSVDEVVTWLRSLKGGKYAKYKQKFIDFEVDGECFQFFSDALLTQYGIVNVGHRRNMVNAAHQLLRTFNGVDDATGAKSQLMVKFVKNGLIICVVIGEYDDKPDLCDVPNDVAYYHTVLSSKYKYKLMSSVNMKGNEGYKMTQKDVKTYVQEECIPELLGHSKDIDAKVQYDALLVAFSGHGALDSLICSDSKKLRYSTIREWFQSRDVLKTIPRLFCVDACRVKDDEEEKTDTIREEKKYADNGSGLATRGANSAPTATIMGNTEGHTVKGGKVAKYLCTEWEKQYEENRFNPSALKPFGTLFDEAAARVNNDTKNDEEPQTLVGNEYDRLIDKVVFLPSEINRSGGDGQDGTAQAIDDDLRNILLPQAGGSNMNLMRYFYTLFNAGIRDNAALKALTEERLKKEFKIEDTFPRKELFKRIQELN